MDSQIDASLQNQNLRTDLRRVAKRIRKSARKSQKAVHFTHIIGINLCRLALGGQTVKKTCVYLRPNLSSTKVHASHASGWSNETNASPFGQSFIHVRFLSCVISLIHVRVLSCGISLRPCLYGEVGPGTRGIQKNRLCDILKTE